MKSWLIVLVPIILFGVLIGMSSMQGGKKDAKNGKDPAKAAASTTQPNAPAASSAPAPVTPTREETKPQQAVQPKPELAAAAPPTADPAKGYERLAKLWGAMDAAQIKPIIAKWKDEDVAPILAHMDNDKVAELLGSLDPDRASSLSKELQKLASVVAPTAPAQ